MDQLPPPARCPPSHPSRRSVRSSCPASCDASHSRDAWLVCDPVLLNWYLDPSVQRHLLRFDFRCSLSPLLLWGPRSSRMPRESLDAPENPAEQGGCQVALGELQDDVPGVPNEAATGLEQALLQARRRPTLDGKGQHDSAQEMGKPVDASLPPGENSHMATTLIPCMMRTASRTKDDSSAGGLNATSSAHSGESSPSDLADSNHRPGLQSLESSN
jgi:hypothetical protein